MGATPNVLRQVDRDMGTMGTIGTMGDMRASPRPRPLASHALVYAGIMLAWTLTWALKAFVIDGRAPWFATSAGSFAWWTTAKLLIWILPAVWLIHRSGRTLAEVFNLANWRQVLLWGGGIGAAIALTGFIPAALAGARLLPTALSIPLFSVLVVAPTFEEFLARGAFLGNLERGLSFWRANVVSALMFVGMHVPGWYFMGTLAENVRRPVGGMFSIFLLGLAFGYAVRRSRSVMGGMLAHFLNNFAPHV